jgi:hypothetical protein
MTRGRIFQGKRIIAILLEIEDILEVEPREQEANGVQV